MAALLYASRPGAAASEPSSTQTAAEALSRAYNDGVLLLHEGKFAEAIPYFNEVARSRPNDIAAYIERGIAYKNLRQYDRAIEDYSQALRLKPEEPVARLNRASAYMWSGQYARAVEDYTVLITKGPEASLYKYRASAYSELLQHDRALQDYAEAIRLNPNDPDIYYYRGFDSERLGKHGLAIQDYSEAIRLKPDYASAYFNRGLAYKETGQPERALEDFTVAIRLNPGKATLHYNRAATHADLRQHDDAVEDLSDAIRLQPDYAAAYCARSIEYQILGQAQRAVEDLDRCDLHLEPTDEFARRLRAKAAKLLGSSQNSPPEIPVPSAISFNMDYTGEVFQVGNGVSAASLLYKVDPDYSEEARKAKHEGTIIITIVVDESGAPRNIRVVRALGYGLDQKAVEAVRQWQFRPGQKGGVAVAVAATVEVNFRLL